MRGVTTDSRSSAPGMVFVSLPERQRENPFQATAAHDRGCAAVVRDRATPEPRGASCVAVEDACSALGWIASALNGHPSSELAVFGVSGRPGARSRLAGVLAGLMGAGTGLCARLSGSTCISGDRERPWGMQGLDATHVQDALARHLRVGGTACVVELGREGLGAELTAGIRFRSQAEATDTVPEPLTPVRLSPFGSICTWNWNGREHRIATALTGRLQLAALGGALGLAAGFGVPVPRLLGLVPSLCAPEGWLEPVRCGQRFGVFVDGARDGAEMQRTLEAARELTLGRLFVVTGPSPEISAVEQLELARVCGSLADAVLVTCDDLGPEAFAESGPEFGRAAGGPRAVALVEPDRRHAIRRACSAARAGDVVVIAGKAGRPIQHVGDVRVPWDDRSHARTILGSLGYVGGEY